MNTYELLFAHNAWANRQVLDTCAAAPAGFLDTPGVGITSDSHLERLQHLFVVERGFLNVLRDNGGRPVPPETFAACTSYAEQTVAGYVELLANFDAGDGERIVHVPWWQRDFEVRECLLQVIAHSAQHRAEVAWALSKLGVNTGELDYIGWAYAGRPAPGTPLG